VQRELATGAQEVALGHANLRLAGAYLHFRLDAPVVARRKHEIYRPGSTPNATQLHVAQVTEPPKPTDRFSHGQRVDRITGAEQDLATYGRRARTHCLLYTSDAADER